MRGYLEYDADTAATQLHRESTMMADVLFEHCLEMGQNLLVDGSLKDVEWYKHIFARIRHDRPSYRIAIIHITAPRDTIINRANARAAVSGRVVPRELLEMSMEQVPQSVAALGPLADFVAEVENGDDCVLQLRRLERPGFSSFAEYTTPCWSTFETAWSQMASEQLSESIEICSGTISHATITSARSGTSAQSVTPRFGFCPRRSRRTFTGQLHDLSLYKKARQIYESSYPQVCLRCAVQDHAEFGQVCTCYSMKPAWTIRAFKKVESRCLGLLFQLGWYDSPPPTWASKARDVDGEIDQAPEPTPTLLVTRAKVSTPKLTTAYDCEANLDSKWTHGLVF